MGDIAKLAVVQKSWSTILDDAAGQSVEMKWGLSQALLNGTCGLEKNPKRAMKVMKELSNVIISDDNEPKMIDNSALCFSPALRAIAHCYFEGNGVEKESRLGLAWLQAAFELGRDVEAAYETAIIHIDITRCSIHTRFRGTWIQELAYRSSPHWITSTYTRGKVTFSIIFTAATGEAGAKCCGFRRRWHCR